MIGWVRDRIEALVLAPQADPDVVGTIDPGDGGAPISLVATTEPLDELNVDAQAISLLASTSRPLSRGIAGTDSGSMGVDLQIRHELQVGLGVLHGDLDVGERIRDRIVLQLVLRLLDSERELRSTVDPDSGQDVTAVSWSVDYRPLDNTPTAWARLTIVVDCQLDR